MKKINKFKLNENITELTFGLKESLYYVDRIIAELTQAHKRNMGTEDGADLWRQINHFHNQIKYNIEETLKSVNEYKEGKVYKR